MGIDIDPTLIIRAEENNLSQHINFRCMNIMELVHREELNNFLRNLNVTRFNITFCFSVTMWIHINYGDGGLETFLSYICDVSDMIVIEPQPWKCYRTALKRLKLANSDFPLFKKLKIRYDVEGFIESFFVENKFKKIHETPQCEWGRKILFFVR